jgi:hypothetical protein
MQPAAATVFDCEFLAIRCRLLDLAAALDRVQRVEPGAAADPRWAQIQQALGVIGQPGADRAERVQMAFSLPYDAHWR